MCSHWNLQVPICQQVHKLCEQLPADQAEADMQADMQPESPQREVLVMFVEWL